MKRTVFFVSDGTGISAESLGKTLLAQFDQYTFDTHTLPFLNSTEKASAAAQKIKALSRDDEQRPIVICTVIHPEVRDEIEKIDAFIIDLLKTFISPLEAELGTDAVQTIGRTYGLKRQQAQAYSQRIEAVHYALDNDDGASTKGYEDCDVILVGVSRSGKTPSCLYMALQYGIRAANYPITEEDMDLGGLPNALKPFKNRIFGLTIDPERLSQIRHERKPNSRYASLRQCALEIEETKALFRQSGIPFLNTTSMSVEEISSKIIQKLELDRPV